MYCTRGNYSQLLCSGGFVIVIAFFSSTVDLCDTRPRISLMIDRALFEESPVQPSSSSYLNINADSLYGGQYNIVSGNADLFTVSS